MFSNIASVSVGKPAIRSAPKTRSGRNARARSLSRLASAIILETFTKSQKVKNLERDPRITVLFEDGETYEKLRGASIRAEAELIQEVDRVHDLHMKVLLRNTPELPREVLEKASRSMAPKKTAILIRPDRVMSWDHGKLGGIY